MMAIVRSRIPVYLLTGFLGSGKTTLLSSWLRQPGLRDAALIINELGEVGLDDKLLASATETPALIANSCVCCTGLPGLEEALEELFWARLQRRMPAFPAVVIETTGLADPHPVAQSLEQTTLLRERYELRGIITTVGVASGASLLAAHPEARAQVDAAQVLIVTKTDIAGEAAADTLAADLRHRNPRARLLRSALADLSWEAVLASLPAPDGIDAGVAATGPSHEEPARGVSQAAAAAPASPHSPGLAPAENMPIDVHPDQDSAAAAPHAGNRDHDHHHEHEHAHRHDAQAIFVAQQRKVARADLLASLRIFAAELGDDLLRLKGVIDLEDEGRTTIQFAPGESRFELETLPPALRQRGEPITPGLTVITRGAPRESAVRRLEQAVQP